MRKGKIEKEIISVAIGGLAIYGLVYLFQKMRNKKFFNQVGVNSDDDIDSFDEDDDMLDEEIEPILIDRQEQTACEFIASKLHNLHIELNFTETQDELNEIILDVEILQDMAEEQGCKDYTTLLT